MKLYNLFENIILENVKNKKILTESVDFNTVKDSIDNRYNINIVYVDNDGVRTNRYIQPYVLGDTIAGNKAIRAYQIFGGSRTMNTTGEKAQGGWRIFRLDRIVDWKPTKMRFNTPVSDLPSFMINLGRFNPNGDKMFRKIDSIVRFNSNTQTEPINANPDEVKPINKQPNTLTPKPEPIKIASTKPTIKQNSYATGKSPKPNIEPKKPINTSNTTGSNKNTIQPVDKNKEKQKQYDDDTNTSRSK